MRRTKLIWFGLGAAVAGVSFLLSTILREGLVFDDTHVAYLVLTEPKREIEPSAPVRDEDMIAYQAGEIFNRCGARAFETTGLYEDHQPTAELPLIAENYRALECVIEAIRDERLPFHIEMRWSSAVADELRTER